MTSYVILLSKTRLRPKETLSKVIIGIWPARACNPLEVKKTSEKSVRTLGGKGL